MNLHLAVAGTVRETVCRPPSNTLVCPQHVEVQCIVEALRLDPFLIESALVEFAIVDQHGAGLHHAHRHRLHDGEERIHRRVFLFVQAYELRGVGDTE